jgi:putative membrane protein
MLNEFGPNHFALSATDRTRIAEAVTAAEAHTAGEIVTVLADASDAYDDIALIWSALIALLALAALAFAPQFYLSLFDRLTGGWNTSGPLGNWRPGALFSLAALVVTIKFVGTWLILKWRRLRLALVPGPIKHARVRARALLCYRIGTQQRTTAATGVLIYLSRAERRAEIVTDPEITAEIPATDWGAAMAAMIGHIGDNRVADGMVDAIGQIGAILTRHFPRAAHDVNELPNQVIEV